MAKPKLVQIKKKKRNYTLTHSQEMIDVAVGLLKEKKMSSYEAEKTFGIPRRTLLDKLHGKHQRTPGSPTRLTFDEEKNIIKVLIAAGDFGSPLTLLDLRLVVYRIYKLMEEQLFLITNYQEKKWAYLFIKRHKTHFPECIESAESDWESLTLHEPNIHDRNYANTIVTEEALHWAVSTIKPFKGPEIDGIFPALLQWSLDKIKNHLTAVFGACLAWKYIPKAWREIKVIFLPKPGKEDYTNPKSDKQSGKCTIHGTSVQDFTPPHRIRIRIGAGTGHSDVRMAGHSKCFVYYKKSWATIVLWQANRSN